MSKDLVQLDGVIVKTSSDNRFYVKLDINEETIIAYAAGNMVRRYIKIYDGDRVKVELSPYDIKRNDKKRTGRIIFRYNPKKNESPSIYKKKK